MIWDTMPKSIGWVLDASEAEHLTSLINSGVDFSFRPLLEALEKLPSGLRFAKSTDKLHTAIRVAILSTTKEDAMRALELWVDWIDAMSAYRDHTTLLTSIKNSEIARKPRNREVTGNTAWTLDGNKLVRRNHKARTVITSALVKAIIKDYERRKLTDYGADTYAANELGVTRNTIKKLKLLN